MKAIINVAMNNSAFESPNGCELARILRNLADHVDQYDVSKGTAPLFDLNGNRVGSVTFTE